MASNAINAQGSTFFMDTGSGATVTITAISLAYKAQVTGTHALGVGDRVIFAGLGGMTEINGVTATVLAVTGTTTFVVDVDTRGFTPWTSAGTATSVTFTQIKELKDLKPSGSSVKKIDKTNLDSTAMEYVAGLVDNGDISGTLQYVVTDPGMIAARAAYVARETHNFKLVTPDAKTFTFTGFFLKFPTLPEVGVDVLLQGTMSVQISGAVTLA